MRSALLGLVVLLAGSPLWATWGVVQQSQSTYVTGTVITSQFPTSVTAGDLILVQVSWSDSTNSVNSVTDTAGNTYVSAVGPARQNGAASTQLFYAANVNGGLDKINVTMSGSTKFVLAIYELAGAAPSNPLDVEATGNGNGITATTASITTTGVNEFVFAGFGSVGHSDWDSPGSGFVGLQENPYQLGEFQTVVSAGITVAGTATFSASGNWAGVIAAFHSNPGSGSSGNATLTSIQVLPFSPTLSMGQALQLSAIGSFSDGSTQDLTSSAGWGSANTGIASVSNSGLATTAGHGTTTITASSGSITGSTPLTVEGTLTSLQVTPTNDSITAGATQQYTATATFSDGTTENVSGSVRWNSSNAGVATINSGGAATAIATGSATITATAASGGVTASTNLSVIQPAGGGTSPPTQGPLVQTRFQYFTGYFMQSPPSAGGGSCSPAPCIAQTFLNPSTAGNLVFIWIGYRSGGFALTGISDSAGSSYTHIPGFPVTTPNGQVDDFWIAQNIAASPSNKITAQFGSGTARAVYLEMMEYSGLATSNAFDVSSAASKSTSCIAPCVLSSAPSAATAQASELLISVFDLLSCGSNCSTVQFTTAPGWSPADSCTSCIAWGGQDVSASVLIEQRVISSIGSYTATATESNTNSPNYNSYLFALKIGP
jgi:Bacterial Ig-like domain (group 2)